MQQQSHHAHTLSPVPLISFKGPVSPGMPKYGKFKAHNLFSQWISITTITNGHHSFVDPFPTWTAWKRFNKFVTTNLCDSILFANRLPALTKNPILGTFLLIYTFLLKMDFFRKKSPCLGRMQSKRMESAHFCYGAGVGAVLSNTTNQTANH